MDHDRHQSATLQLQFHITSPLNLWSKDLFFQKNIGGCKIPRFFIFIFAPRKFNSPKASQKKVTYRAFHKEAKGSFSNPIHFQGDQATNELTSTFGNVGWLVIWILPKHP